MFLEYIIIIHKRRKGAGPSGTLIPPPEEVGVSASSHLDELAAEFGCHRSTISRALKKSGIEVTHEASKREALTERVLEMYESYMRPVDIGKELGINVTTVRKILHENGVHIRSSSEYKGHTR